jgi:uncharacterized protein YjbJ (UPF0337 family)
MTEDILKGKWKQMRGHVQKQWGKFTDDELDQIEGDREILLGKLQEKYGYTKEQAQSELDTFMRARETDRGY